MKKSGKVKRSIPRWAVVIISVVSVLLLLFIILILWPSPNVNQTEVNQTEMIQFDKNPILKLWKEDTIKEANLSEEYFNEHFEVTDFLNDENSTYAVFYNFKVGEITAMNYDEFSIILENGTEKIELDNKSFGRTGHQINSILPKSELEAKLNKECLELDLGDKNSTITLDHATLTNDGKLIAEGWAILYNYSNACASASINAETGEIVGCSMSLCAIPIP